MPAFTGRSVALWLGAVAGLGSCTTIDRPTGPPPTPIGPRIAITQPSRDTTVNSNATVNFTINVTSATGIDTIFTEVLGAGVQFPVLTDVVSPVTYGVSVPLSSRSGEEVIILRVTAVDAQHQPGDTALRVVHFK